MLMTSSSQSANEAIIRGKRNRGTGMQHQEIIGNDGNIAKARKMLDMSQTELSTPSSGSPATTPVPSQSPSAISPALSQIPNTVTIPTMMKQPMPLMPTVPIPPASLRSSGALPSAKVRKHIISITSAYIVTSIQFKYMLTSAAYLVLYKIVVRA